MYRKHRHLVIPVSGNGLSVDISLIYHGVLGISVKDGEVTFAPYIPSGCSEIKVSGLKVCGQTFRIDITREKTVVSSVKDNENTEANIQ